MNVTSIQINGYQGWDYNDPPIFHHRGHVTRTFFAELFTKYPKMSQPYILRGATGLDPEDINGPHIGYANTGYRKFNKSPGTRNVTLLIGLNPQWGSGQTYETLRSDAYKWIASSRYNGIEFRFMNGTDEVAHLTGQFTKFETSAFSGEPAIQLTLECDHPFLRSNQYIDLDPEPNPPGSTHTGSWREYWVTDDLSDAPHGVEVSLYMIEDNFSVLLWGDADNESEEFVITWPFLANDTLHITSEFDHRSVFVTRPISFGSIDFNTFNVADSVGVGSLYPMMYPGLNKYLVGQPEDLVRFSISWRPSYWGV